MKGILCHTALLFAMYAFPFSAGVQAADPSKLQHEAIAKIDRAIDYYRKTGETRTNDIIDAERILIATTQEFLHRDDSASAAPGLVKLAATQRMQASVLDARRDERIILQKLSKAVQYSDAALRAANAAGDKLSAVRALLERAKANGNTDLGDLSAAGSDAERAVSLAGLLSNDEVMFDALELLAQIQRKQNNFNAAMDSISRALALSGEKSERSYYGYKARGDIYLFRVSAQCKPHYLDDACFQSLERSREDYVRALGTARDLGWQGLAEKTRELVRDVDAEKRLAEFSKSFSERRREGGGAAQTR